MKSSEQHPLIDLAATLPDDASASLRKRRTFFRNAGLAAFAASSTAEAFAQNFDRYSPGAPPTRYPEVDVIALDKLHINQRVCATDLTRLLLRFPLVAKVYSAHACNSTTSNTSSRVGFLITACPNRYLHKTCVPHLGLRSRRAACRHRPPMHRSASMSVPTSSSPIPPPTPSSREAITALPRALDLARPYLGRSRANL